MIEVFLLMLAMKLRAFVPPERLRVPVPAECRLARWQRRELYAKKRRA